ncbi:hypothetical protein MSAN_01226900 [Mycena sanguinolenta]|uniref:Uncharacterized protein n=1 Tax=Mycena sanguinolenta TaxID=230812 RepID=A0A8H6YFR6_9AGAR|nr:hypothetical protein MSAN_01226900 [Mycena sanguinolenta]
MPVSFSVAECLATSVNLKREFLTGLTAEDILASVTDSEYDRENQILQFSLTGVDGNGREFDTRIKRLIPDANYNTMVLRPDDVWLSILCQFNFFVNANRELLRASFVAHEGKRELTIINVGTRWSLDFGSMARQMGDLINKTVSDPTLREWAIPTFSTTTATDTTVASVMLMATLKQYFEMRFVGTKCGIPRVTLEGEKADWVDILGRLEKLKEYGVETVAWYHLLRPVIARFVHAFDAPDSAENVAFWSKIVHHDHGSGYSYYTGWINAFVVFTPKGKWLGHTLKPDIVPEEAPESMSAEKFWTTYAEDARTDLVYDGTPYHRLDTKNIAPGYATVGLTLDDNGVLFDCAMVAGVIGTQVSSSGDKTLSKDGKDDTVRPVAGWWMFAKKKE